MINGYEHKKVKIAHRLNGDGDCQKIVTEKELGGYLAKGWKVQAVLPSGRIAVDNEY